MTLPFDIFRVEPGGVRWLEPAATLEDAQARVQKRAAASLGKYLILNQKTGKKIVMQFDNEKSDALQMRSETPGDAR